MAPDCPGIQGTSAEPGSGRPASLESPHLLGEAGAIVLANARAHFPRAASVRELPTERSGVARRVLIAIDLVVRDVVSQRPLLEQTST